MTAPQAACPGRGRPSPDCCGVNSSTCDVTRWLAGAVAVHLPARHGWYDLLANRPPMAGQYPVPRVLPRRHRHGAGRRTPNRLDGPGRPPDHHHPAPLTYSADRPAQPSRDSGGSGTPARQFHRLLCPLGHSMRLSPTTKGPLMTVTRPATVTAAFLLVLLQILIAVIATVSAALAPADYKTYAVTTPVFLVVLYGAVAFFLWAGRPWARVVAVWRRTGTPSGTTARRPPAGPRIAGSPGGAVPSR